MNLITNTTVIPNDKLHNLFMQCKKVTVSLSIDSYGKLNEFLRKGTSWKQTTQTIDWFQSRKYHLYVHSVASIYNCNVLLDLINYCKDRDLKQKYVLIDGPDYMMPRNLPAHIKQIIIDNLYKNISKNISKNIVPSKYQIYDIDDNYNMRYINYEDLDDNHYYLINEIYNKYNYIKTAKNETINIIINKPYIQIELELGDNMIDLNDELKRFNLVGNIIDKNLINVLVMYYLNIDYTDEELDNYVLHILDNEFNKRELSSQEKFIITDDEYVIER